MVKFCRDQGKLQTEMKEIKSRKIKFPAASLKARKATYITRNLMIGQEATRVLYFSLCCAKQIDKNLYNIVISQ